MGSNRIAFMPGVLIAIILFREVQIAIYRIDNCKTMDVGDRSTSVSCDRSDYLLRNWSRVSESSNYSLPYETLGST